MSLLSRNRYRLSGLEGLNPKLRIPHIVHRTPPETAEKILQQRREKGWCPILIEGYLHKRGTEVGHTTIHRLLKQAGLNNPLQTPRHRRSYRRWQRRHPNSLWQCDLKVIPPARWLITILDDHSRYVTGSQIFKHGTTENVISLLDKAVHEYAKPREILTDHGSQFWSVRGGESSFDAYCESSRIKHILGGIGKPTTLGKIERWFRTYDQEHARFPLHWKFIVT